MFSNKNETLPDGFSSRNSEDKLMLQFGLIGGTDINLQPRLKYVVVHGLERRAGPGVCKKHRQDSYNVNFQNLLFIKINQLDALNFIISLFQASTCFEHMCSSSVGQNADIIYYIL